MVFITVPQNVSANAEQEKCTNETESAAKYKFHVSSCMVKNPDTVWRAIKLLLRVKENPAKPFLSIHSRKILVSAGTSGSRSEASKP